MSRTMGYELVQRGRLVWSVGGIVTLVATSGAVVFGCAVVLGCAFASGCATSGAAPAEPIVAEAAAPATAAGKTEQVVQRVMPVSDDVGRVEARAAAAARATEGVASAPRDARGQRRDSINSKHLEAELNRLEAELGR